MAKRTLRFRIGREYDQYRAHGEEYPNLLAQAKSLDELVVMPTDAINSVLDQTMAFDKAQAAGEDFDHSAWVPGPDTVTRLVGFELEIEHDMRPPDSEAPIGQPPRPQRHAHRERWPPGSDRSEGSR